jgi:hypothetical protein
MSGLRLRVNFLSILTNYEETVSCYCVLLLFAQDKYMENWEFNNENTGLFLETPGIYSFFRVK